MPEQKIHSIPGKISKWAFTQAMREVDCKKCGVAAGEHCKTPKGKKALYPHADRTDLYIESIGVEEFKRRHTTIF